MDEDKIQEELEQAETAPLPQMRKNARWIGIAIFFIALIALLFIGAPAQYFLGLLGLGITEIALFIVALLGCLWLRSGWRETFPVKKPTFKESRGTLYVYIGTYCLTLGSAYVLLYMFPGMNDIVEELDSFLSGNWLMLFITVAIMPAICEEALFRGTLQSAFRDVKSTAVKVCIVGFLFGLFHLDPYRLIPTMLLGMGLTYMMIKTGNILYPMFFHLFNNFISILPTLAESGAAEEAAELDLNLNMVIGVLIVFVALGMLFIPMGVRRLNGLEYGGEGKGMRTAYTAACIIALIVGLAITGSGVDPSMLG